MSSLSSLEKVLRAEPPASVAALPLDVQDRLAEQIVEVKRRQVVTAQAAVDKAIKGVPLPVRGVVRKAING